MSSNKTIFPGMENSNSYESFNPDASNMNSPFNGGGTIFPGMNSTGVRTVVANSKPVVGFLYSVSHTPAGEFWPLHIGPNTIGRSSQCDICLSEGTVSQEHAKLVVRVLKNPEKTICSLQDASSTCGSMVNGNSLNFEPIECHNGDIITIGEHYQLYLILIDNKKLGLSVDPHFMNVETDPFPPYPSPQPYPDPISFDDHTNHFTQGTVGIDGMPTEAKKGNTIIMPKK